MLHFMIPLSQFSLIQLIYYEGQRLDCYQVNSKTTLQDCYQGNICSSVLQTILVRQEAYVYLIRWDELEL